MSKNLVNQVFEAYPDAEKEIRPEQAVSGREILAKGAARVAAAAVLAGHLKFTGLTAFELRDFFVVPEQVQDAGFTPANSFWYDVDGFWFRPVRERWFKIPDLTWVEVYRTSNAISYRYWGLQPPWWADPTQEIPTKNPPW